MSAFGDGRGELVEHLSTNYNNAKEILKTSSGIAKSVGHYLYYRSYIDKELFSKDNSPYNYLRVKEKTDDISNNIIDRVLTLLENGITMELYGLGFKDLLRLDLATFEFLETRLAQLSKQKSKTLSNVLENGLENKG